jgi:hypothetical protein
MYQGNSSPFDYRVFPKLKQNLSGQKFKDHREVRTVALRSLITSATDWCLWGIDRSSHDTINSSNIAGAMWKCSGRTVPINMNLSVWSRNLRNQTLCIITYNKCLETSETDITKMSTVYWHPGAKDITTSCNHTPLPACLGVFEVVLESNFGILQSSFATAVRKVWI